MSPLKENNKNIQTTLITTVNKPINKLNNNTMYSRANKIHKNMVNLVKQHIGEAETKRKPYIKTLYNNNNTNSMRQNALQAALASGSERNRQTRKQQRINNKANGVPSSRREIRLLSRKRIR